MRYCISLFIICAIVINCKAQEVFSFLNIPSSAHAAAVGGNIVSPTGFEDISLVSQNPAVLDSVSDGQFYLMYNPYLADIQKFDLYYGINSDWLSNSAVHLNYIHLGAFEQTDASGNVIGEFSGSQYSIGLSKGHDVSGFTLGYTGKIAVHHLYTQTNLGVLADIGGIYRHPLINWSIGMTFRNFGYVLNGIDQGFTNEIMDIVLGSTIKPEYMPFRFTLTLSGLAQQQNNFSVSNDPITIQDRLLRYANIGASLVLSRAIEFTAGYNHLLRQELRLEQGAFGSGLSFGAIVRIGNFEAHVTHTTYSPAGGATFIALQNNFQELKKIF